MRIMSNEKNGSHSATTVAQPTTLDYCGDKERRGRKIFCKQQIDLNRSAIN